jgi:RimJ/RimL family protein N-acetyltransferase
MIITMNKSKIQIRPILKKDAPTIAKLGNNKKIWNNIRDAMPHPYHLKDAESFIASKEKDKPNTTFGITINDNLCGLIGLEIQKDIYRKSAELGYWLGESYWGKGLASEAVKLVVKHGFEHFDIERIFAAAFEYNIGSIRVLEKNGFVKEGIARKAVFKNNAYYDEHRFSKLRND